MPTFPWLPEAERERCSEDHRHYTKGSPCPYRDLPPAPPQHTPTPGSSASALQARTRRLCRSASALPEPNSCSWARREARRRSPNPEAHFPGARRRRRLPVSSSNVSGPAGGDHAQLYLPPPSPAGINAAAEGCFPRYYNNQQATARSEPLRRRPPAARTTLSCGRRRMASPRRAQSPEPTQAVTGRFLGSFSLCFPHP